MGKTSPRTKSQPPGWVFGVVWPVLFLLLGWSWMQSSSDTVMSLLHLILVVLLNLWVFVAGCRDDYTLGLWLFIPIIGVTLAIFAANARNPNINPYLIVPLLAWLLFAQQLNFKIIEK